MEGRPIFWAAIGLLVAGLFIAGLAPAQEFTAPEFPAAEPFEFAEEFVPGLARGEDLAWGHEDALSALDQCHPQCHPLPPVAVDPPEFPPIWHLTPNVTFQIRGRVDTDFLATSQSAANEATFGDLGDVIGLRRARIGAQGDLGSWGRYVAEIDMASGQVEPRDMFVGCGEVNEFGEFRTGHFREPFSLELGISANSFAFMERSPVNLLDPARNWGLALYRASNDTATLAGGVFHAGAGPWDFRSDEGSTVDFTGRVTAAPINEGNGEHLLHFGLALSGRVPEHGLIIINEQPRNPLLSFGDSSAATFVPVIRIPASFQQLINVQCAWANGPLWVQSEWYGTIIDQTDADNVFYHGSYAACGYFVTGEHRAYLSHDGAFGGIRVERPVLLHGAAPETERGWGAWELTARYAWLDFVDADTPPDSSGEQAGIRVPTGTFGVNWYLSDHVRFLFNYTYEVPDDPNTGSSVGNIFGLRLNVFW